MKRKERKFYSRQRMAEQPNPSNGDGGYGWRCSVMDPCLLLANSKQKGQRKGVWLSWLPWQMWVYFSRVASTMEVKRCI